MAFLAVKRYLGETSLALKYISSQRTFMVVLVYVLSSQSDSQTVSGGIQGSMHIPLYSIISGRENIFFVKYYL